MEGTKKFYQMTIEERREEILKESALSAETLAALSGTAGLSEETADRMIENVIGRYSLPLGIARAFDSASPEIKAAARAGMKNVVSISCL